ncbi:MAG: FtsX-like permease family protein [bacterium]
MLTVSYKIAKSNILHKKERTLLTMFSIALSIFISFILLSLVQGFLSIVEKSLKNKNIEMIITTKDLPIEIGPIIINPSIHSIPYQLYSTLELYQDQIRITPVYKNMITIDDKLIPIISLDFEKIKEFYPNINITSTPRYYALVGKKLSKILQKDKIQINNVEFPIQVIDKELNGYEDYSIFIDFRVYTSVAKRLNPDQIWINNIPNLKTLIDIVNQYPDLRLIESKKVSYIQETIITTLKILQVIMVIASISIALIASTNTILITTFERIPEFTILLAIGSPRGVVFLSIMIESLIISIISSLFGMVLGIIVMLFVGGAIQKAINISIPLIANTQIVIQQIIVISFTIGIISSILPAYIASTIEVQSNIRI